MREKQDKRSKDQCGEERMKLSVKRTTTVLVVVAGIVGSIAVWMSSRYIDGRVSTLREDIEQQYDMVPVVAAARDLPQGERLGRSTVTLRRIPRKFLPPDYIAPARVRDVEGMAFRIPLVAGQVISHGFLTRDFNEAQGGFSEIISPGMRALTFPVDVMSGVGGLLNPGDRIDLIMSIRSVTSNELVTLPLLQDLQILAVGDSFVGANNQRYQHITLEVSPRNSARILQARQEGALTAVLRRRGDDGEAGYNGPMTVADLFDGKYQKYFKKPKAKPDVTPALSSALPSQDMIKQLSRLRGPGHGFNGKEATGGPIELIIGGGPK